MNLWLRNNDPTRPPLYDRVPLDELEQHFSGGNMIPLEWIAVAGGLIMLLLSSLSLRRWWINRHQRSNPRIVFYRVATGLNLTAADVWLLYRIARQQRLPTPLTLLMSPATLRHHAARFTESFGAGRTARVTNHVERVAQRIFSGDVERGA